MLGLFYRYEDRKPLLPRAREPKKAQRHEFYVQAALLIVTVFISVAHLCRWGDGTTVGWGYKLLNGLSITSGGRWLVPFLTESDPDSHSTVLLSPVSQPTGGFVLVCEWQMGEWVKTAQWGWTCEAGRERQTSPNYIQDSRFDGTQINLLWHSPVRTVRIIYNGVILW